MAECDCGATTEGKWAGVHAKECASGQTTGITDVDWLDAKVVELSAKLDGILEKCAQIAEQIDDCHDYRYDNGFTSDGYGQAKRQIAEAIRQLKET